MSVGSYSSLQFTIYMRSTEQQYISSFSDERGYKTVIAKHCCHYFYCSLCYPDPPYGHSAASFPVVSPYEPSCEPVSAWQPTFGLWDHSAPRSWHERDFCLMNLPTSRSRWYRGTRLDRKRLAREVMLSRWPPPYKSSAQEPGAQGGWPLASRTAHSRSSEVRWSREAEISRYRQL